MRARPLSTRLAWIIALMIVAALAVAGTATTWRLQSVMLDQIDRQLVGTLTGLDIAHTPSGLTMVGPSDYVVMVFNPDRELEGSLVGSNETQPSLPQIPAELLVKEGQPFTVASEDGAKWRVVTGMLPPGPFGPSLGYLALALPLDSANQTLRAVVLLFVWVTMAVVAVAVFAGHSMVTRSLRPLAGVERAAAAIAQGDLSTRVPKAAPGTEVGSLTESLNTMLSNIEAAFAVQQASEAQMRRFVADASHELRTPLAAVRGYAELYRLGALSDQAELSSAITRIEDEATRMGHLVGDLLSLTRLDEGQPVAQEPIDLLVLANDALHDAHALDPDRTTQLLPTTGLTSVVLGDEALLRRAVANLLSNAINHTPKDSAIELSVGSNNQSDADWAFIEVRDHGPGIPDQVKPQVFERFFRLDRSRSRDSGGSGLGLAIVAGVAQAHGGLVDLSDTPGGGATFRLYLPAEGLVSG
ncbi:MAG: HAMP domain-containing histidine kinase [Micrococcales bacterium]|nr:HAMP domain-containing histidine kinase [Micrococcales bacterium]